MTPAADDGAAALAAAPTVAAASSVHLLGIRHHGPGSARTLVAALDALAPDAVLIELPAEAEPLLALAGDVEMSPPVALLGYVVDRPERAAFYPFANFSPEWCALGWARQHGVTVRAIDLPLANVMAWPAHPGDGVDADHARAPVDAIGALATAAGYDDPERWWEDVVEHRAVQRAANDDDAGAFDPVAAFAALADAMAAVRATAAPAVGQEAAREATMRQSIRAAQRAGARTIAVVCGAWHVPALATLGPANADATIVRALPKVKPEGVRSKVAMTWVPWSHRRLASASGYGAGVHAPGWYAHVYDHPGPGGVTSWFVDVARLLRRHDHQVSPDHLIAASRLATTTAHLRDRPVPGLDEVLDAARAVLAGGQSGPLELIHDELVVGDRLGTVPPSTPMVPLARDVVARAKGARLKQEAAERVIELDLRTEQGRARSHLLHRLSVIGVPWGRPDAARSSSGTFREPWRVRWDPELAIAIVEASAYGTTLPVAATARLVERLGQAMSLTDLTALVEVALLGDLPDAVMPAMASLSRRAALDPDTNHLMDALVPLARVVRYGDVRGTDAGALRHVVDVMVARVVAGVVPACQSLADDAAAAMVERLSATQAALALVDHRARDDQWASALASIAGREHGHGLVHGRATRLLHDLGTWDGDAVSRRLAQALSVGTPPTSGAAFVEGFLSGSGVVLLHDRDLVELLDGWLSALPAGAFESIVALLRRTFGAFELGERRQLGELVSGRGDGRSPAPFGWDLDEERAGAAIATVAALLGVPRAHWRRSGGHDSEHG